MNAISEPLKAFPELGDLLEFKRVDQGHINETYEITCTEGRFILQSLSPVAFKKPSYVMSNIDGVTRFMVEKCIEEGHDPKGRCLRLIPTKDGKTFYTDKNGNSWRVYNFVDGKVFDAPTSNELFEKAGKGFGRFQYLLSDYPSETLFETIPDFHNTPVRYKNLRNAVRENASGRKDKCLELLSFVEERKGKFGKIVDGLADGSIPLRTTHNDTKLNNIIFDKKGENPLCVIDLDTIMPGSALYDFGDSIRFGANTAAEDEKDLSKVSFSLERFESFVKGFMAGCNGSLTRNEIKLLFYASWLITMECGMRFLTDYLEGDLYFRTSYTDHNLVRAKDQFALALDMERKQEQAEKIINRYL